MRGMPSNTLPLKFILLGKPLDENFSFSLSSFRAVTCFLSEPASRFSNTSAFGRSFGSAALLLLPSSFLMGNSSAPNVSFKFALSKMESEDKILYSRFCMALRASLYSCRLRLKLAFSCG